MHIAAWCDLYATCLLVSGTLMKFEMKSPKQPNTDTIHSFVWWLCFVRASVYSRFSLYTQMRSAHSTQHGRIEMFAVIVCQNRYIFVLSLIWKEKRNHTHFRSLWRWSRSDYRWDLSSQHISSMRQMFKNFVYFKIYLAVLVKLSSHHFVSMKNIVGIFLSVKLFC